VLVRHRLGPMEIHISLVDGRNLTAEIYRQLREAILDGRLRAGDRLPPTRELARGLKVSRSTASVAYERLLGEGFVTARVGAGTFVSSHVSGLRGSPRRIVGPLRARPVWDSIDPSTAFARPIRFDFRCGLSDVASFPWQTWRRLIARELRPEAVGSGAYGQPAGDRGLREAVARHIGISRRVQASAEDITITSGTQQALDIIGRTLLGPGDHVAVEDPGYPPARRLFESLGARVTGVPVDPEGIVVDAIAPRTRVVYVTPSHQFPLGVSMSLRRRLSLLAWAGRHHAAIIEDDYDSEFRFYDRPIEPLRTLDDSGRVIYVGSFSKTMVPTFRLGFVLAPPSLTPALHAAKFVTDWHSPLPQQRALAGFIDEGEFARHVRKMSVVYRERHEMMTTILGQDFDEHLEVLPSAAGLHVSATARGLSAEELHGVVENALDQGIAVQTLDRFAFERRSLAGLAIGYGAIATSQIAEGLRRLGRCFRG
jgi:GntR family transcriptional regulator / MocR family aminotransferase